MQGDVLQALDPIVFSHILSNRLSTDLIRSLSIGTEVVHSSYETMCQTLTSTVLYVSFDWGISL